MIKESEEMDLSAGLKGEHRKRRRAKSEREGERGRERVKREEGRGWEGR